VSQQCLDCVKKRRRTFDIFFVPLPTFFCRSPKCQNDKISQIKMPTSTFAYTYKCNFPNLTSLANHCDEHYPQQGAVKERSNKGDNVCIFQHFVIRHIGLRTKNVMPMFALLCTTEMHCPCTDENICSEFKIAISLIICVNGHPR
jgi:hypothetical protein